MNAFANPDSLEMGSVVKRTIAKVVPLIRTVFVESAFACLDTISMDTNALPLCINHEAGLQTFHSLPVYEAVMPKSIKTTRKTGCLNKRCQIPNNPQEQTCPSHRSPIYRHRAIISAVVLRHPSNCHSKCPQSSLTRV